MFDNEPRRYNDIHNVYNVVKKLTEADVEPNDLNYLEALINVH